MVVLVLISGGAAIAIQLYRKAAEWPAEEFEEAIFSVKQQAGVIGAMAAVVFAVLAALQHGKQALSGVTIPQFGSHRGGVPQTGPPSAVPQAA